MSFAPPMGKRRNTFNIIRQVNVDDSALVDNRPGPGRPGI